MSSYAPDRKDRIAAAIAGSGYTRREIAAALNVAPQAVSAWSTGRAAPGPENLRALSELLGLSLTYLQTGRGPAVLPPGEKEKIQAPGILERPPAAGIQCPASILERPAAAGRLYITTAQHATPAPACSSLTIAAALTLNLFECYPSGLTIAAAAGPLYKISEKPIEL